MSLQDLLGQPIVQTTLERAFRASKLHHAYRFEGPPGVGKETAAMLLAQALLCESPTESGGCGMCSACRRAVTISDDEPHVPAHPDFIIVGRGVYPSNLLGGASEATGISVEQIRRIVISRVGYPPHEGRALVIMIRAADELTIAAANALLKTLEEPSPNTHFILLTSRPRKLLDTIRSRTLAVRFGALPEDVMKELLTREELDPALSDYARGSLARARDLAHPEVREAQEAFLASVDEVLAAEHPAAAVRFADKRPEGRGDLGALLTYVATTFAIRAREPEEAALWAARHQEITRAQREVEANGSPALVLEALANRLMHHS